MLIVDLENISYVSYAKSEDQFKMDDLQNKKANVP